MTELVLVDCLAVLPARTNLVHSRTMAQQDLFGGETKPAYTPELEHVRNRLEALFAEMAAAQAWPWDESVVDLHRDRTVPYLLNLLPDAAEAADWRSRLEGEIDRLSKAA